MGNSGQNGSRQSNKSDATRSSKSDRDFQGIVPRKSVTFFQTESHPNISSSKNYVKHIKAPLSNCVVVDVNQIEESCEVGDSEERPPLKPQNTTENTNQQKCILLKKEFEFLNFRKTISVKEEESLLNEAHCVHNDLLHKQMSEFETRVSMGQQQHLDEDEDILSMEELRNTIPFRYTDSRSSENLNESFMKQKPRTSF